MEGHSARGQRLENISYVNFWAACDTYMKIWKVKVNKLLHKPKNTVTGCWNPRDVGTFVKGIHY
jgi:hypothetical protein